MAILITMTVRKRRKKARAEAVTITPDDAELELTGAGVPEVVIETRLPREQSVTREPMQRLTEAEAALRDVMSQLSERNSGSSVPQHVVDDAWRTATEAAERLRTIAAKVEAVEAAAEHSNADQRAALDGGAHVLLAHLERGIDGYRDLIAAAGHLVLVASPNSVPDELVEATDKLAGLASALQELSART